MKHYALSLIALSLALNQLTGVSWAQQKATAPQNAATPPAPGSFTVFGPGVWVSPLCPTQSERAPVFGSLNDAQKEAIANEVRYLSSDIGTMLKYTFEHNIFPPLEPVYVFPELPGIEPYKTDRRAQTPLLQNELRIAGMISGWLNAFAIAGDPVLLSSKATDRAGLCVSYSTQFLGGMSYSPDTASRGRRGNLNLELPFLAPFNNDLNRNLKQFGFIAHELGHYLLLLNGHAGRYQPNSSGITVDRANELAADCFAGYFASTILPNVGMLGAQASVLGETFTALGEAQSTPESHGSATERQNAFLAGLAFRDDPKVQKLPFTSAKVANFCAAKFQPRPATKPQSH